MRKEIEENMSGASRVPSRRDVTKEVLASIQLDARVRILREHRIMSKLC